MSDHPVADDHECARHAGCLLACGGWGELLHQGCGRAVSRRGPNGVAAVT
ncbi:hypothetical protein UO65_1058 [Actinokineospora spheciospongiae]|uniref:Uncharacterized protein n=1 Tax=Actinokineospora spheciospongiae TaxID=909613 RepID=W7JC77_9PSEU|nr:hypothetical protein UO65_1058 [Actinokineospora spheciospongiae]